MKKLLFAAVAALIALPAFAADVPLPPAKAVPLGYPSTRCGFYYGVGTGGAASAVDGAVVGTQIVQGELDAIVGYTCPFGQTAFWFAEGSVGYNNVNGSVNGFALSGPLVLMQRAGAGSPISSLINPFGSSLSMPTLPLLPAGVTQIYAQPYLFAGVVEQDISARSGLAANRQWLIAPMIGAGLLTRLTNGAVVDTWAGWQMNSQSFCPGGSGTCGKLGNGGRVGVSFKF